VKIIVALTSLVSLSLPAASQVQPTDAASIEKMRVRLAISDWQPLRYESVRGVMLVQAALNGYPATLLVDTGSARTLVDQRAAKRSGIRLSDRAGGLQTGSARMVTQLADEVTLEMPHVLTIQGSVPAADLSGMSAALGRPIAGVLGGDVLNRLALLIRPTEKTLGLVASGGVNPSAKSQRIPIENGQVTALIGDRKVRLAIDLGFNGVVRLTDKAWAELPGAAIASDRTDATGTRSATQVKKATLKLGKITASSAPIDSGFSGIDGADGLLGLGFFSQAITAMDATQGWLVLEPLTTRVNELPPKPKQ
jgi:predicted aspartyl protease